jgi:single-stranded-DNA-specific exonuclease
MIDQKSLWLFPKPIAIDPDLIRAIGGDPIVAELLTRRGLGSIENALAFLDPDRYTPAPPIELPDLEQAAERLYRAITRNEKIVVWGDFDADGQTSTTLLYSLLRDLGANATYYIPNRLKESHGIKIPSLARLIDQHLSVLLTCDTGIAEHAAIAYAKQNNVTVLVSDHHDLPDELPNADALINPKRLPSGHPLRALPGVGVAFKLAQQILHLAGEDDRAKDYLDLVALGIVADVAHQSADTRYLLQRGLAQLRVTHRLGLKELMQSAKINPNNLSAEHIGFGLGPRLNALGRLGDANLAVELLTTTDLTRARILASQIEGLNNQRKLLMEQITSAAQEEIAKDSTLLDYSALVISHPHWQSGVVGPVANRLAEQYARPTILLVEGTDGMARGSARSIAGVDISAAIKLCAEYIDHFGGHPGAAGMALPMDNIPVFRAALSRAVDSVRDKTVLANTFSIDAEINLDQATLDLAQQIDRLAPFGEGNPSVTLATRGVTLQRDRKFGRKSEHREVTVVDDNGVSQKMTWWRGAEVDLPQGKFDVAYAIKPIDFYGAENLSIEWLDFQVAEVSAIEVVASKIEIEIIDWRNESDLAKVVREYFDSALHPSQGWQPGSLAKGGLETSDSARTPSQGWRQRFIVWSDGSPENLAKVSLAQSDDSLKPSQGIMQGVVRRYDLTEAESLIIWSPPCGMRELSYAIERVKPTRIFLCVSPAAEDKFEPFIKRLAGLLKHDLTQRAGHIDLARLAAALGQRLATTRKGIEWLEDEGQIKVIDWGNGEITIVAGNGEKSDEAEDVRSELRMLLAETAAWRAYYRRMDVAQIRALLK